MYTGKESGMYIGEAYKALRSTLLEAGATIEDLIIRLEKFETVPAAHKQNLQAVQQFLELSENVQGITMVTVHPLYPKGKVEP